MRVGGWEYKRPKAGGGGAKPPRERVKRGETSIGSEGEEKDVSFAPLYGVL